MSAAGIFDRRHRALSVGVILAMTVVAFEGLALATVAPAIARDLGGIGLYGWIFSAFLLAQIVAAVAAGQRVDRRGIAGPFLLSLVLFGVGLLAGALATNMAVLVLGRALQGLGAGALATCVYAIVNTGYPDALRPRMIAAISSAWVLPALVGPTVAGFVAEQLSWRAVFYGFLPLLAVVGLLSGRTFRPPNPAEERAEKDSPSRLPGALLLTAGGGLLLVGLKVAAGGGLSVFGRELAPVPVGLLLAGLGAAVAFPALRRLLPAGTFSARAGLPATVAARGLFVAAFFHTEAYLVLALTELSGYGATSAGLVVSAGALGWTASSWLQARRDRLEKSRGRRRRALAGVSLMLVGISALTASVAWAQAPTLAVALAGWTATGLGMGMAHSTNSAVAFARAPKGEEGAVSSSLLLVGPAASIGAGGALVALGATSEGGLASGVGLALVPGPLLAALALASAVRMPRDAASVEPGT